MKLPVKLLVVITILLLSVSLSHAQLTASTKNNIKSDIIKVIEDYPNHFKSITGDLIIQNPQSADYSCNFKITGAEECTITKYSSGNKDICSWQALMFTTENFVEAKNKFRLLYTQLNNLRTGSSRLTGIYESPEEEKKFTGIIFSFDPGAEESANLKVELVMENEIMEWKIKILIYDRDREDNEKGKTVEESR